MKAFAAWSRKALEARGDRRRRAGHALGPRGLLSACALILLPMLATGMPSQVDPKGYASELRVGLMTTGLPAADINWVLRPLVDARLTQPVAADNSSTEPPAKLWSLQAISAQTHRLGKLRDRLRAKYRIRIPRTSPYIEEEIKYPPTVSSWFNLSALIDLPHVFASPQVVNAPRPEPLPLRWTQPLRIAATGVANHDAAIAQALETLRLANPRLPIDARSFPAPIGIANVLVDARGVRCPLAQPCSHLDMTTAYAALEADTNAPRGGQRWHYPLIVFDQWRAGRWIPDAPVYGLPARFRGRRTTAWLRTDGHGRIRSAFCVGVTGIDAGERDPLTAEDRAGAVQSCLAAILGAPSHPVRMFDEGIPNSPDPADQSAVLGYLYR